MQLRRLSIVPVLLSALLLAACGSEAPAPKSETEASRDTATEQPVMGPERRILAFGNSLFAGYNVASEDSYPAKLEASLRAKGINARVTNAGVSGDTTAAGLQRLTFTLDGQQDKPDLFILELGGNDLLRGLPVTETRKNIEAMLQELQKREIPVLLMGMRAPPNFAEFQNEFDSIYPQLAQQYGAELVPFFLESIYQKPEMIQSDRVHPTEEGIETLVGATVEAVVRALPEE
ncbi:arylesterase [Pontixanthobacter aestiaquae]|nr:arylesterase [Pontixanthobacter aestiaquae]MDN3644855.1 arylesterase [Pontixanthobacter aestiaquae]